MSESLNVWFVWLTESLIAWMSDWSDYLNVWLTECLICLIVWLPECLIVWMSDLSDWLNPWFPECLICLNVWMPECLILSDGLSSGHRVSYYSDSLLFWSPYIQYFIQPAILCTVYQHVQSYRKLDIWLHQEFSIRHSAPTDIQQCSDSNYLAFRTIGVSAPQLLLHTDNQ